MSDGFFKCPVCNSQQSFTRNENGHRVCDNCKTPQYANKSRGGNHRILKPSPLEIQVEKLVAEELEPVKKEEVAIEQPVVGVPTICPICHTQLLATVLNSIEVKGSHVCISCATVVRDGLLEYLRNRGILLLPDDTNEAYELARQEIAKMMFLEDFVHLYMLNEKLTEPMDRFGIFNYQVGDICKMLIYMKAYPERREGLKAELKIAVGDAFVQLMCLCRATHINFYECANIGLDKLANREWEKKKDKTQAFR